MPDLVQAVCIGKFALKLAGVRGGVSVLAEVEVGDPVLADGGLVDQVERSRAELFLFQAGRVLLYRFSGLVLG